MRFPRALRQRIPIPIPDLRRSLTSAGGPVDQPPHLVGASFAIGLFVAALPTPGLDTVTLLAIGWRFEWANRWAFALSLAILNPVVKSFVYVGSFALGAALLGPGGEGGWELSLAAGPDVLSRLVLGNVIVAVLIALAGYAIARYWASVEMSTIARYRPSAVLVAVAERRPRLRRGDASDRPTIGGVASVLPIHR